MGKTPHIYYSSDWHFGHTDIINFERTQFSSVEDHDEYLVHMIETWADKWEFGSTLWFLGDFGNPEFLWVFDLLRIKGINVNFLFGNHDRKEDFQGLGYYVNNIYFYPTYLSQKLVVSHFPVAVYKDQINICGHLHGAKLADDNHIVASVHVANYRPIAQKHLETKFSQIAKFNRRFLYEPFANDYLFTQPKEDVIMDKDGRIDLAASRVLQRFNTEKRKAENNSYQPYCGTGSF